MISKVKVSATAVNGFRKAASEVRDFSQKFDRGIACFEQLMACISENISLLNVKIDNMHKSLDKIRLMISDLEKQVAKLTAEIEDLENKLSELEDKLQNTPETITIPGDEEGETIEDPNPEYTALEAECDAIECELIPLRNELSDCQQRLERLYDIENRLDSHVDAIGSVIFSLDEKKNTCKQLISRLEEIQSINTKKCSAVCETLVNIEDVIRRYIGAKMVYNDAPFRVGETVSQGSGGININVNINKVYNNGVSADKGSDLNVSAVSKEEIDKHQIKFDPNDRICEYDGREYGCKYNTYEEQISRTSRNNPVVGTYEGERGESKFVPTDRSAEGIAVIEILKDYGLDGIVYRNGEPDFEVCARAVVTIEAMTEHRDNYEDNNGVQQLGNFSQADIELAKIWNFEEREGRSDWLPRDVYNFRKARKLTWHEKCDTKTMVLVRTEINAFFKHLGGCSECRVRDGGNAEGGFDE